MRFVEDERKGKNYGIPMKKGKQKCLVCGKVDDWDCRVREDEKLGLCSFVPNESGTKDKAGRRWIHYLSEETPTFNHSCDETLSNEARVQDVQGKNAENVGDIYHCFLLSLALTDKHKTDLLRRGLSQETVKKNMYATVPNYESRHSSISMLSQVNDLAGIAGFYTDGEEKWCLHMTFPGFYVPYRDKDGNIVGMQIRRDDDSDPKYMWLSSSGKEKGASSGVPLHFVKPEMVESSGTVFITEGALKADIIGERFGVGVIATAGVNSVNPKDLQRSIYDAFPNVEKIVIAYDMDWTENEQVYDALFRLVEELIDSVVKVEVWAWDISIGKGLDDVVMSERFPDAEFQGIPADEFLHPKRIEDSEFPQQDAPEILDSPNSNELIYSWDKFANLHLSNEENVVFGVFRGNVGLVVASTNLGKSTLSLNLALSATSGRSFAPLLNELHSAKRVLYIDGESTKPELQSDISKMLLVFSEDEVRSVKENLYLICDEEFETETLDLANPVHLRAIENKARNCKPDLVIVDTLSALMSIDDENDNAKVKREVMQPLKELARKTNSAVLLLHHTGKYNEGYSPTGAYKGRGASALGALARAVFCLERDDTGDNRVVLSCPKAKGESFERTLLELNRESRWFAVNTNDSKMKQVLSPYQKVVNYVCESGKIVKRSEMASALNIPDSTLGRILAKAEVREDLKKASHGSYIRPNAQEDTHELAVNEEVLKCSAVH